MLRVSIDLGNATPYSGIGVYGSVLMDALRRFGGTDVSFEALDASWAGRSFRPLRRLVYLFRIHKLVREDFHGSDVVHFVNYYAPRKAKQVSYVTTVHDLDPIIVPRAYTMRYRLYFEYTLKKAIDRSSILLADSQAVRDEFLAWSKLHESRVRVAGTGLSFDFLKSANQFSNAVPDEPILLFVGQLNRKKNCRWLVRSIVEGIRSGALPRLRLVLAGGRGFGSEEVLSEIQQSRGIAEWKPSPTNEEIINLYSSCSAVVLPSLREGFGRPLLEAMYCGKPVIASKIPSSLEVAGDAAYYFSLGNKDELFQSVNDALVRKNFDNRKIVAAEQLDKYSWENLVREYVDVYREASCRS